MERTYYLYGIISSQLEEEILGVDGSNPLFSIEDDPLKAVVSQVETSEFGEEVLNEKIKDLSWLTEKASLHMEIIKMLHSRAAIIPVKFCTLFTNEDNIVDMLKTRRMEYLSLLNDINGKDEYGVKIYVDENTFLPPELEEARLDIERLIEGAGKGKAFLLKKNLAGKLDVKKEEVLAIYKDKLWRTLLEVNSTGKMNKNVHSEISGKKERMVLNSAFLVAKDEGAEFFKKVDSTLRELLVPGLLMEMSGPWPPYNFCT